jgi:hypothetical protein
MTTYLGFPVYSLTPLDRFEHGLQPNIEFAGEPSQIRQKIANGRPEEVFSVRVIQRSLAERAALRTFFDQQQGRTLPFWIASSVDDFETAEPSSVAASSLKVKNRLEIFGLLSITRHVENTRTGERWKVLSSTETDARANVALNIDPAIATAVLAGDALRRLFLVRFGSDYLETRRSALGVDVSESRLFLVEAQGETP